MHKQLWEFQLTQDEVHELSTLGIRMITVGRFDRKMERRFSYLVGRLLTDYHTAMQFLTGQFWVCCDCEEMFEQERGLTPPCPICGKDDNIRFDPHDPIEERNY